jgi:parallel beta-helix repeat protein
MTISSSPRTPDRAPNPSGILDLPPHDPIYIDGNSGFTNASGVAWGSGTESDPYIIENWNINASLAHGINIQNTDVHFIIRYCHIYSGDANRYADDIRLYNCRNGTIDNNNCSANSDGIHLEYSSNIILIRNNCSDCWYGIQLLYSSNNTINDNQCFDNYYGILLQGSCNNNTGDNNTCIWNSVGICVAYYSYHNVFSNNTCRQASNICVGPWADFNVLDNNTCSDGTCSITLSNSNNNTLRNNNCSANQGYGIGVIESDNNTLEDNICNWMYQNGIVVSYSNNNTLNNNSCCWNGQVGVYINAACNNTLTNNTCSSNGWNVGFDGYGILVVYSSCNNTILCNTISDSRLWGLYISAYYGLQPCTGNRIWNNTFFHNNGAGDVYDVSHTQAFDENIGNWWNSTDGYGNWWSDWTAPDLDSDGIVDVPYDIAGGAGAKDHYPLTTPQAPIPELGMMPLVVMVILATILLTYGMRRRKA